MLFQVRDTKMRMGKAEAAVKSAKNMLKRTAYNIKMNI